ncbi:MAG: transposase, partial [Deltaproteobacteria bacterium]|nr:transposase [Deltaproteobacteria bacterium]
MAEEVRYWGNWVLKKVKAEIGDLYPLIPDPEAKKGGTGFQPVEQELFQTKRNLPHWQMGGATYFVTFRTRGVELPPEARELVLNACLHFDGIRYNLWTAVVMPDHVHLLLQPKELEKGNWHSLSSILHSIKSFTANKVNDLLCRKGTLWQDESYDRIVRDEAEFYEKWNYIRNNPVKNGLADSPERWTGFYENTGKMPVPPDASLEEIPPGYLVPVAYLWTRTVRCKNPSCGATVPLVKQTWLCKKKGGKKSPGRYVALKVIAPKGEKKVRFEVVEATTEKGLGFDPSIGSKGGNATCPFCGTVADSEYVKQEGAANRIGHQLTAVACSNPHGTGNIFITEKDSVAFCPEEKRLESIEHEIRKFGIVPPKQLIEGKAADQVPSYGMVTFGDLFTKRSKVFLLHLISYVRIHCSRELTGFGYNREHVTAIRSALALGIDRVANYLSTLCVWRTNRSCVLPTFSRQALAMVWDYGEMNPFSGTAGDWGESVRWVAGVIENCAMSCSAGKVKRGSADRLSHLTDQSIDAVVTDPPYYDNVIYSDLADFFYVWLKEAIGDLYPDHFATELTPKRKEAVSSGFRHENRTHAREFYENMMLRSFQEANRVLKPESPLVCIYAHKTTAGWATLVDAMRVSGFEVLEAWPIDTEMTGGMRVGTAALASSIFLVARKREGNETGSYEDEVQSELDHIVRERVDTLWKMGITGADLVIAAVGAGLRAFTRFARVEYANGEEVPAEKFLAEVEGVVLETLLEKIFGVAGSGVAAVDGPSRFYVLWRYTYKAAEMDAGEAIVFTYGQNVELDGQNGLSSGSRALVEKKKGKYRLYDFTERGDDEKLGL